MLKYAIIVGIWLSILIWWLIPVLRERIVYEIYAALGVGTLVTMIVLASMVWHAGDISLLIHVGWVLYIPASIFVLLGFISLKREGKPETGWEQTTVITRGSVFGIVRHPLYLGGAIYAIALAAIIQSVASMVLGLVAVLCLRLASREEDQFNVRKFGNAYKEYMTRVPAWNFLISLARMAMQRERRT